MYAYSEPYENTLMLSAGPSFVGCLNTGTPHEEVAHHFQMAVVGCCDEGRPPILHTLMGDG